MHNVPNLFSGASLSGNTAGALANISSGTIYLAGGNNMTLSQNANSVTFSGINAGAQNMSFWQNMGVNGSATDNMAQTGTAHGSLRIFQLDIGNNIFAGNMTVQTVLINVTVNRTATIGTHRSTVLFGVYSLTSDSLSLVNSASVTFGYMPTGTATMVSSYNASSYYHGKRWISIPYTAFSNTTFSGVTMSQGLYYGGLLFLSSGATMSMSHYGAILGESGQRSGTIGVQSVTNTYFGALPYCGVLGTTTTALLNGIVNTQLQKTSLDAIFIPHIIFNNLTASF